MKVIFALLLAFYLPAYSASAGHNRGIFADDCERLMKTGYKASKIFNFLVRQYDDSFISMKNQFLKYLDERKISRTDIRDIDFLGVVSSPYMFIYVFQVELTSGKFEYVHVNKANFHAAPAPNFEPLSLKPLDDVGLAINKAVRRGHDRVGIRNAIEKIFETEKFDSHGIASIKFNSASETEPMMYAVDIKFVDGREYTITVNDTNF
jgi:hypothetical protein